MDALEIVLFSAVLLTIHVQNSREVSADIGYIKGSQDQSISKVLAGSGPFKIGCLEAFLSKRGF